MMKYVKLKESVNDVKFDVSFANIKVYHASISEPIIRYSGDFEIRGNYKNVIVTEKFKNEMVNMNLSIQRNSGKIVITGSDNSINVINGNGFTGNKTSSNVEFILPNKTNDLNLTVNSKSGNLTIEDLILSKLIVSTMSGDISLNDIDILFSKLKTMSGDININVKESMLNYRTFLDTMSGDSIQNSIETTSPIILSEKRILDTRTMSGDIKILFKGRR